MSEPIVIKGYPLLVEKSAYDTLQAQLKIAVDCLKTLQVYVDDMPAQALTEIGKLDKE